MTVFHIRFLKWSLVLLGVGTCMGTAVGPAMDPNTTPSGTHDEIDTIKEEVLTLAQEMVRDFPDSHEPKVWLGIVYQRLMGNGTKAQDIWSTVLEEAPQNINILVILGMHAVEQETYDRAMGYAKRGLALNANLPVFYKILAKALQETGRHQEAVQVLKETISRIPQAIEFHYLLGQSYLQLQDYPKAESHFRTVLAHNPENDKALYGLITVSRRLKKPQEAKAYMLKFKAVKNRLLKTQRDGFSKELDNRNVRDGAIELILGGFDIYRKQGQVVKAERLLDTAVRIDPQHLPTLKHKARFYQEHHRPHEALGVLGQILTREPDQANHYQALQNLARQTKSWDRVEETVSKIIQQHPQLAVAHRELAVIYLETNRKLPEAMRLAERAVKMKKDAYSYYVLSWACVRNGKTKPAYVAIKKAVDLAPGNQKYAKLYTQMREKGWDR